MGKGTTALDAPPREVIVGALTDWPLAATLAAILKLPDWATRVGCFQAIGNHGNSVMKKVFDVAETVPLHLRAFDQHIHAALAVCTWSRAATLTSRTAYHANLSPEELRAHLSEEYLVRSPGDALDGRRLAPVESLKRIEQALTKFPIFRPRKALVSYLEGGPLRESLLAMVGADIGTYLVTAYPEAYNEVDDRLFTLWARTAWDTDGPPQPNSPLPELGFDRFGSYRRKLVGVGVEDRAALDYLLRRSAIEHAKYWPSTGVWMWERLRADASTLSRHILAGEDGACQLVELLTSVLWLPEGALRAGALDTVLDACASVAVVPKRTLSKLRAINGFAPLLAFVQQRSEATGNRDVVVGRAVRRPRRLLAER